ncbi:MULTISPECIES: serine hydrolase domain-containing protein [Actinomadura]|uniref:Serine hydrolase domain-containing protein n=1 Tax=Actinomadura yumaensis TaxID=111807 RepID=A0ABW2CU64_9ACTN|nr:serine hydrolase [Actinomadura sp. J1-007]MWK34093.1 serine hydrolase [Actinomadura sp. J1-007]
MFRRGAAAAASAAVLLASVLSAPARAADDPLPLPLLPHVPFYSTTTVAASDRPEPLPTKPQRFNPTFNYQGKNRSLDDFLKRSSTLGYLVLHGGTVVDERYFSGYNASSRFNSWSVGKSITATAVGAAIADGKIESVRDPVTRYVPELRGTGYDGVSIEDVLQMASGHKYDETDYTNPLKGSTATTIRMVLGTPLTTQAREAERDFQPGTRWNYDSMNTFVLGWLVTKATGKPLAAYVGDKIWRPAGMQSPLLMGRDYQGSDIGYCCYHATVRDFARFGLLYLRGGRAGGRQVIPTGWINDSTTASKPYLQPHRLVPGKPDSPENAYGYGNQWWLGDDGDYAAIGILGQFIYVSPKRDVVIVKTSQDLNSAPHMAEALPAFRAVADAVAKTP